MKCVICHGEDIQVQDIREELKVKNDIVYVQIHIPVCRTCGERYYDRRTIRYLEDIERKLKQEKGKLKEVGKILVYT